MCNKSPEDILYDLLDCWVVRDYKNKPGEVIKKLPNETREILKRLKSNDISTHRLPKWIRVDT